MESSSFWNPESTVLESGIQYPESGIHSMESRIQDCPAFPYMGRLAEEDLSPKETPLQWEQQSIVLMAFVAVLAIKKCFWW